jgi:SAM-dependent methyltransferase
MMSATGWALAGMNRLHAHAVLQRREEVLARSIARILPPGTRSLLDVGCGDGVIAAQVGEALPDLRVQGLEVLDRKSCRIPYGLYDGKRLPFEDGEFDYVQLVDMLHHTEDIPGLFAECARVARKGLVIKDHIWSNRADLGLLYVMDWVGNRGYGVNLTYNYQKKAQWLRIFAAQGLRITHWQETLGLYPAPLDLIFGRRKHFLARLEKS